MTTFEKVRFQDRGTSRTVILRDPANIIFLDAPAVRGIEVNAEGDEVVSGGADERLRIIAVDCIVWRKPMQWNLHYGTLELAPVMTMCCAGRLLVGQTCDACGKVAR